MIKHTLKIDYDGKDMFRGKFRALNSYFLKRKKPSR